MNSISTHCISVITGTVLTWAVLTAGLLTGCGKSHVDSSPAPAKNAKTTEQCPRGMAGKYYFDKYDGTRSFIEIYEQDGSYVVAVEGVESDVPVNDEIVLDPSGNASRGSCVNETLVLVNLNEDLKPEDASTIQIAPSRKGIVVTLFNKRNKKIATSEGTRE